ncbi:chromatin associated protein KTI12 [Clavulina sp. PMI_390]|nr:chromatin associated protein KTI12 [Clavulina sp. PMI_390]
MACITISGFPCSGKTTRAMELKTFLEARISAPEYEGVKYKVSIVSDELLDVPRSAYDDGRLEKPARSTLLTAITRQLSEDTLLIIDGMNYIKGYRYQIYCAAREVGVLTCTIFVVATPDQIRERNSRRDPQSAYNTETLENLISRYEEPSSMVRWDSPLFTVPWDEALPSEDIFQAVTGSKQRRPNQGVVQVAKPPADALQILEQTSNSIVTQILSSQSSGFSSGGSMPLTLPSATSSKSAGLAVNLPARALTLSELQRQKRQFVAVHKKAVTQGLAGKADLDWSEETVARKFIRHLEENLT